MIRRLFQLLLLPVALLVPAGSSLITALLLCNRAVEEATATLHTDRLEDLPESAVGLVLGCAPLVAGGRANLYFTARMDAAALLFHEGKVRYLLVSGDNGRSDYDETAHMVDALVRRGVPPQRIVRDHAGFDTLDSIVRAREVFGLERFTVISQRFHNERALYIATHRGINAVGWNAADLGWPAGWKTKTRERFARVKTILEIHLLRSKPRFLGPRILIGTAD